MVKLNPNDICDYLASRVDEGYKSVKFKECIYNALTDELIATFLFDEKIKGEISGMKPRLEQEFKAMVGISELEFRFLYKQCYMDSGRLEILVQEFLRKNFSFLTLDLADDDLIVTRGEEGFTAKMRMTRQAADYIKGSKVFKKFVEDLAEGNFALFNFAFEERECVNQEELTLEDIEKFAEEKLVANTKDKVDKVCKVSNREYLLGVPIKERPIKIEHLTVSPHEQVIAGTISFFTRREFVKKDSEEKGTYWTFILDDGQKKQSCVYFLSGRTEEVRNKNVAKMELLGDGQAICVVGICNERNGRVGFNVRGVSSCVMG